MIVQKAKNLPEDKQTHTPQKRILNMDQVHNMPLPPPLDALKFLSHPTRWQLIQALAHGPANVRHLSDTLSLSPAKIRHHLHQLQLADLVRKDASVTPATPMRFCLNREAVLALSNAFRILLLPPVVSVVAKSGTGKTTFIEKLLPALKARGLRVGVLKHHGHPTPFDVPGKDTYRLSEAGADIVVGASAVQVAEFSREDGVADMDAVIVRHFSGVDMVLTEGYKCGPYPKIEVHRAARSDELLCEADELLLLVTDENWPLPRPQFGLEEADAVADWLVGWLHGKRP